MSTTKERKSAYEQSSLKVLMDSQGHEICPDCYCCELVSESATCPDCCGLEDEETDEGWDVCSTCDGEGEIFWSECIGKCDENGNHVNSRPAASQKGEEGK